MAASLLGAPTPGRAQIPPLQYFGIAYNDPRVREFQEGSGVFLRDTASLTDPNGPYVTSTDLAFDGNYYYTIDGRGKIDGVHPDPRVRVFNLAGVFVGDALQLHEQNGTRVAQAQSGIGKFGNFFYTIAAGDNRVRQFDSTGLFLGDVAFLREANGTAVQQAQTGIDFDGTYFYTVADGDRRVRRFDSAGFFLGDVLNLGGQPFPNPIDNTGIAVYRAPVVVTAAPEPGSLALLGMGLVGGMGIVQYRHRRYARQQKKLGSAATQASL